MAFKLKTSNNNNETTIQLILARAEEHAGLVQSLDDLQPSVATLDLKSSELTEVEKELEDCNETIEMLKDVTKRDQKALQHSASGKLGSKMKRLFSKGSISLSKQEDMKKCVLPRVLCMVDSL